MADQPSFDDLWPCPACGHRFVTTNTWHSCTRIDLDAVFARSEPGVREAFDAYVNLVSRCGPVTVIAQKTRVVIMARVRFAGAIVRRRKVVLSFALTRRLDDPRYRITTYGDRWIAHHFEARSPADLEIPGLPRVSCEAYRDLGMQESLRRRP